ncbi:MAG: toll/interleukin-1 receptor domain-containing protein [Acetobacteraceae bacterium]
MATLREYYDADFAYAARVHLRVPSQSPDIEASVLYDFSAFTSFVTCYVPGDKLPLKSFIGLIEALQPGTPGLQFDGRITLPSARTFPGRLEVRHPIELRAVFFGDSESVSTSEIPTSTRIFIYSESQLTDAELSELRQKGRELNLRVQVRSRAHAEERSRFERPLAFISHDSRDKPLARSIALGLQKLMCPVWYDEFSLTVGANLRDSIEDGLKKCHKCVLILSPHFFANGGWTKKEFDSIFSREILEQRQLVLPVWCGVTKEEVYEYCPSLANVKGLDLNELGESEVIRLLCRAILDQVR